jgi:16S rRNA (cytidine1402-2'-O)-methyltransferase
MSTLYIIATPIGNMEDITYRAVRILNELTVLACEDTRNTKQLLTRCKIKMPDTIFSYHEHNEEKSSDRIIGFLLSGVSVGITTDAGLPGISDPGYRAVTKAIEKGINVEIIPGASSVPTALLSSGLSTSSFTFKGFAPRKEGQRIRFLEQERDLPHTLVFFESKYRLYKFLEAAYQVYGNRKCAVCLELTKKFEEITRGYLADIYPLYKDKNIKGEITVVIAGNNDKFIKD